MVNKPRLWDYSTIDLFQKCPRKYYYRIVKDLTSKTTAPTLLFGSATHNALEYFYNGVLAKKSRGECVEGMLKVFEKDYEDIGQDDRRTIPNGIRMLKTYAEIYKAEPFEVIAVEVGFSVPFGDDIYCGRLDLLVRWNGILYVMEHKTTTSLNANYFRQWDLNLQIGGYIFAAEETMGEKCQGAIVNCLEVWKDVKRATAKTKQPEDHFARDPKSRNPYEREEFKTNASLLIRDIKSAESRNSFRCSSNTCFDYNYRCPYFDLCKYGWDERIVARDFKVEKWEPYKMEEDGNVKRTL